jgi:glutamate 5-kinase
LQPLVKNYKRIVVKIGSSLFYPGRGNVNSRLINDLAGQISSLIEAGKEVVIVASGAIALGLHKLGQKERPRDLGYLQSISAIGQNELMNTYSRAFGSRVHVAQILLTWDDFNDRARFLNAKNTILSLLKMGNVVPIINENDTVSTEEIKFGDNDQLSARVASLISADILIILSDVDGLLDKDKKTVIRVVDEITPGIKALACPSTRKTCVGGMVTKIEAAKIATGSGIPCVIANGNKQGVILSVIKNPSAVGTLFISKKNLAARERWIAFGSKPKGKIIVDQGARQALAARKSLLSVGVLACEGGFESKDIVCIMDNQGREFARGKVNISSEELEKVKGVRSDKEVIHCDNIVIL